MKSSSILVVLVVLLACNSNQQTKHEFNNSLEISTLSAQGDTVESLANNIMVIYQDQFNNYWFGSWELGLYKYDGTTLINYTINHGLPHNRIDDIQEDSLGNIYSTSCHPTSTITKYNGSTFTKLIPELSSDWELNSTDLWFKHAYSTENVYRYDGTTLHELKLPKPSNLFNSFEIYSIYKDSRGNVWFGSNPSGVCRYNGLTHDWITEEDVTEFRLGGANGVRSILEDENGDFWFNAEFKYSVYDSAAYQGNSFYSRKQSIGSFDVDGKLNEYLSSVKDADNNLWFVTYRDGIWKYDGSKVTHYPIMVDSEQIELFSIYKDKYNKLWVGTHNNGAYFFNGTSFEKFKL